MPGSPDQLVSIIMCTYNGSKFVVQQMESLCNQTYSALEIIISDDCSSDGTFNILQQYAEKDSRIQLFRNERNVGYIGNFSNACKYASGFFIAISDQDDVWHAEKISLMMKSWIPGAPLMYCNSVRFTDEVPWEATANKKYRRFKGTDSRKLAIFNTISGHASMYTKSFIESILPFPGKLSYDWYAGVVAACNGGVGYVDKILVFQRVHGSNVTVGGMYDHNVKESRPQFKQLVLNHLQQFAVVPGMPDNQKRFYVKLLRLWSEAISKKFSWPLFFFIMQNRKIIYNYKQRKFGLISHIKHTFRLVGN